MAKNIAKQQTVPQIKKMTKTLVSKGINDILDMRARSCIFCDTSGTAKIKIEMPDGSETVLTEVDTDAGVDNLSMIKIKVKVVPIEKTRIKIA